MTRFRLALIAIALVGTLVFFVVQSVRWSGATGAGRAHQDFLTYIENRRWSKCHAMLAEEYSDRWGFDRDDISLALQDFGSPFTFGLSIDWTEQGSPQQQDSDGAPYALTGTVRIDGNGHGASMAISYANGYAGEPFTFLWRREGLLPWRWRLISIDHPSLEVPAGYQPGDVGSPAGLF